MHDKSLCIKNTVLLIVTTAVISVSVIPGYLLIGSLIKQGAVTLLFSFTFVYLLDRLKVKPIVFSYALSLMIIIWTLIAIILQINTHIKANDYSLNWYVIFYYDKIALLYVTAFTVWFFNIFKLLNNPDNSEMILDYKKFSRIITITLTIFYFITLIYSFVLCRSPSEIKLPVNLIPFNALKATFFSGRIDYELLFLFLGNIAVFLPLGAAADSIIKNKHKLFLILLPIVFSSAIELSQYYLGNGNCDIDDIILNVFGFYLGVILNKSIDKTINKLTHGKLESVLFF